MIKKLKKFNQFLILTFKIVLINLNNILKTILISFKFNVLLLHISNLYRNKIHRKNFRLINFSFTKLMEEVFEKSMHIFYLETNKRLTTDFYHYFLKRTVHGPDLICRLESLASYRQKLLIVRNP